MWYKYVKDLWKAYQSSPILPILGGVSLNRQEFIPGRRNVATREIVNNHEPFLFKLIGSQGFSPNPIVWARFLQWVDSMDDLESFEANVPGLVTSDWYKRFDKG